MDKIDKNKRYNYQNKCIALYEYESMKIYTRDIYPANVF